MLQFKVEFKNLVQITSNDSIPGAISYPFTIPSSQVNTIPSDSSEDWGLEGDRVGGGEGERMIQKTIIEQIIDVVFTATRKALSQQLNLSMALVMGLDIFNHSGNHGEAEPVAFSIL